VIGVREDNYLHIVDLNTLKETLFNMNQTLDDHVSFSALHVDFNPVDPNYLLVTTDRDRNIIYKIGNSVPVSIRIKFNAFNIYIGEKFLQYRE
jgi:hypothetical protein